MMEFNIDSLSNELREEIIHKINNKTKPLGSLGRLEEVAIQISLIQATLSPEIKKPSILVFAGDHGIANDGVSAYPQEVTAQMVLNFINGGAAINVFTKQHNLDLKVIDAGVNFDFNDDRILDYKVGKGTQSYLHEEAMSKEELDKCFENGSSIVDSLIDKGTNVIGFGEMGIGNTSSASLIMSKLCQLPLAQCVGSGTGLDENGIQNKLNILQRALNLHTDVSNPVEVLRCFGGFEIAQMTGAMLRAAERKALVLVDGFISTAAFLVASAIAPAIKEYAIISHVSNESGHQAMVESLGMKPVLDLGLRLGEATGCAIAYPIVESSLSFLNEMASFESAEVSQAL